MNGPDSDLCSFRRRKIFLRDVLAWFVVCLLVPINASVKCVFLSIHYYFILKLSNIYIYIYILGQGVNWEGFNLKLAVVKMCSTWPLLNKYTIWNILEEGLQTPPLPKTPCIAYENENLNFIFTLVKMYSN